MAYDFKVLHADTWTKMLPKLNAEGKHGYRVVGFLSEVGGYSALLERGLADNNVMVNITHDAESLRRSVNQVGLGPREKLYQPCEGKQWDDADRRVNAAEKRH